MFAERRMGRSERLEKVVPSCQDVTCDAVSPGLITYSLQVKQNIFRDVPAIARRQQLASEAGLGEAK